MEVRLGELQRIEMKCEGGKHHVSFNQKLVDVLLSVDIVRLAWGGFVDKIILVSGDRDFLPAVNTAKEAGVIVKLIYANPPYAYVHTNLLLACDERQILDEDLIKKSSIS
ncbi:MAG: NYN domain-containing protein [Candidatus Thermoplasmatota archaeon]|nr:NYN domain-containing protein [Candidatus Thermoplasmatota archaeon]